MGEFLHQRTHQSKSLQRELCKKLLLENHSQQEIDYIEEADGNFTAFEMKWNPNKRPITFPSPFLNNYPVKETVVITPENYLEWVM